MNDNQPVLNTSAVDLFAPANGFAVASKLYGRLHRWWLLLRKYWWMPAAILIMLPSAAIVLSILSGPTYESKASLWVTGQIKVDRDWSYTEELVNFLGTQAALLQSPRIQRGALAKLSAESKGGDGFLGVGGAENATAPFPFRVKVLEGAKSSTLELRAIGKDPALTRKFLDFLMAEYLSFKQESHYKMSEQASSSLGAEATKLTNELAAAEQQFEMFQASNNMAVLAHLGSGAENNLASLNHQLVILRMEQRLLESLKPEQWIQTDYNPATGDGSTGQSRLSSLAKIQNDLAQAEQQMRLLSAQRDELAKFLRPAHPKIVKLNQDIAAQQQIMQAAQGEAAKQFTLRKQALAAQIMNLEKSSAEWEAKSIETTRKVAEYERLQQNVQRLQAAFNTTFGVIKNRDVANSVEHENVGILDPASVAKSTHRMLINLSIAIVLALALSFGLLYGIALFQDHFASSTELAQQLDEPVVGQIPAIPPAAVNGSLNFAGLDKQRFEFLEAFRGLRASLLFMNSNGRRPKIILVTSSLPQEGKSTVAMYLAATLAEGNSRVLLVDGDMRRPVLHQYFGLSNGQGLAEMLNGECSYANVIFPAGMKNLALLPAGIAVRNPGDLMLSPAWESFLAAVTPQFDFILVDTPPVAATDDAATLAPSADGVLFVVRALATSARVARSALDNLRQRQTHVLGLVLNRAVSSPCEHQYYQPYAWDYDWKIEKITGESVASETSSDNGKNES
jgi:capsular exopolysaccharide synthesis family protein